MAIARVGPNHQIIIPASLLRQIHLAVGDLLEVETRAGAIMLTPIESGQSPGLTSDEQARLSAVRRKIEAIRRDLTSAPGLRAEEAELAVRAGLIAEEECWWWLDEWLEGEREANREIREARVGHLLDPESTAGGLRRQGPVC